MEELLIDIPTRELLKKFGAGRHKPGSGSASAFQGMLAAQLILTVIRLTIDPKRKRDYANVKDEFLIIKNKIEFDIYIVLEKLFQQDSDEFDNVIKLREERDNKCNLNRKRELKVELTKALGSSTKTPLLIAKQCIKLVEIAIYVFNNGFKSARGDSAVAANGALSAVAGCLSIIELNLLSLPLSELTSELIADKIIIGSEFDDLSLKVKDILSILKKEVDQKITFLGSIAPFQKGNLSDTVKSNDDIEKIVRDLQNTLWLHQDNIWKKTPIEDFLDVLDPKMVFEKVMNYNCSYELLGNYIQDGEVVQTAGIIDKKLMVVKIGKEFPAEIQNFTAAHELGHAILHRQPVLHRDRPIDPSYFIPKSIEESQADKFATFFLMPSKFVKKIFFNFFEVPKFVINENMVLAGNFGDIQGFRDRCKNCRGLARILAATGYFGGKSFLSLERVFKVSNETMAIRLEELDLLEF